MSDHLPAVDETEGPLTAAHWPGRRRWQLGLRTLVLLMAAIAVWLSYFVNRRYNAALESRISAISPLAHELIIDDPTRIAAVKLDDPWLGENRWDIYLPEGAYRLCLATHGIGGDGLAPVNKSAPIASGTHQLAIEQRQTNEVCRIRTLCDGAEVFAQEEPKESFGSDSTTSDGLGRSEQRPADQPIILLRRRFLQSDGKGQWTTPTEPTEGILLWIEPIPNGDTARTAEPIQSP